MGNCYCCTWACWSNWGIKKSVKAIEAETHSLRRKRNAVQMCRDEIRKVRAQMDMTLSRNEKNRREYTLVRRERLSWPPKNERRELATISTNMSEAFSMFFASDFSCNQTSYIWHIPKRVGRGLEARSLPL